MAIPRDRRDEQTSPRRSRGGVGVDRSTARQARPWPSCRHTHPTIDAASEVRDKLRGREIDSIQVETYAAALDVCDRPTPQTAYDAKFSLQHCVAASLCGDVDFDAFEAPARKRLAPIAARVTLSRSDGYTSAYPRAWGATVTVALKDGATLRAARDHAKGDPEAALARAELIAKARMLLAHGGVANANQLIEAVLALADDGPLPHLPLTA